MLFYESYLLNSFDTHNHIGLNDLYFIMVVKRSFAFNFKQKLERLFRKRYTTI